MAELVKPQYHSKSSYPSSRSTVYNVAPAQEKYRGPDENAGQVDLSSAKIFDELQDGLAIFGEIYTQSEKTANVLQAKSLLVKKMKDTQRITELLATELPNTGYEHLKLKDVLDKYKARDLEGKSDLYLGSELQHNISSLQMPTDISDNVKSLIEDDWLKMDIAVINDLIGQVDSVQSAQTLEVHGHHQSQYKGDLLNAFMNKPPHEAMKIAEDLRAKMDANTDELSFLGTWTPSETQDQKLANGQFMLEANYLSQFFGNREQALSKALGGAFQYKDKTGKTIKLNPIYWKHHLLTEKERVFQKNASNEERKELNSQELSLSNFARNMMLREYDAEKGEAFSFEDTWMRISNDKQFSKIPPQRRFQIVFEEEIRRLNKAEQIKQKQLGEVKTEEERKEREKKQKEKEDNIADLQNKLHVVAMNFERNPEKSLQRYAVKDKKTGLWKAKTDAQLQTLTSNPEFRQHYITAHLLQRLHDQKHAKTLVESEILDARGKELLQTMELQAESNLLGASDLIHTFMRQEETRDGKKRWVVDYSKLGRNDSYGSKILLSHGIGTNPKDLDRSNRDIQSVQAAVLTPVLRKAVQHFKHFTAKEETTDWNDTQMNRRLDHIANSYITNIVARMVGGPGAKQRTIEPYPEGKAPQEEVKVYLSALENHLESVSIVAEGKDGYSLQELNTHIANLKDPEKIPHISFTEQHVNLVARIIPAFNQRMVALTKDKVETGFAETGQEQILKETGRYDIEAYYKWQTKFGVPEMDNLVPKALLENIKNIGTETSHDQSREFLIGLWQELDKFGDKDSNTKIMAFDQMVDSLPYKWKNIFESMYETGREPNRKLVEAEWLRLNNPDYCKKGK